MPVPSDKTSPETIHIHPSQFPHALQSEFTRNLNTQRALSPKFHYQSYKQTALWLRIHHAYAPIHTETSTSDIYTHALNETAEIIASSFPLAPNRTHPTSIISIGSGSGVKDELLYASFHKKNIPTHYTAIDVSTALIIHSLQRYRKNCHQNALTHPPLGITADFSQAPDLTDLWQKKSSPSPDSPPRIFLFFGMLPNVSPESALSMIKSWMRPGDFILLSANLMPEPHTPDLPINNPKHPIHDIIPLYDNPATKEWLLACLTDIGIPAPPETLTFSITPPSKRKHTSIEAHFNPTTNQTIDYFGSSITFSPDHPIKLFFSNRFTPSQAHTLLTEYFSTTHYHRLDSTHQEGIYLCTL